MASYSFVAMGNPLLDIQVRNGEALLQKYELKANDAILVEGKQKEIYDDIKTNYDVVYVAGGAAQNAARAAQYVLPDNSTAYLGAVGEDDLADQLRAANDKEGLKSFYQVIPKGGEPTGACAVVITGHNRSLATLLGAAEKFTPSHLEESNVKQLIEGAKFFYLGGFFLTHGIESATKLASYASEHNKMFAMNLSAPFIPQFFKSQVDTMLPLVDVLFGNESEAEAYAASHDWNTKDIAEIASKLAALPKKNTASPRLVVITQGASSTIVATPDAEPKVFPVTPMKDEDIVDTNGAGDAFAGAFCGALLQGKDIDTCVDVAHQLGQICVASSGPTFKWPKVQLIK
ncbi:uncharacterized protein L969DRAFT_91378 [Mixia osmundae IAM 14324]|uniref:Adenosine kinase n=1 Tax=Mixia osmundae (strain CBS 9802 / IAM 14324 / JCM 22182 / KY 12970) TaxID=764103 RepID=G7E790_MIXOS|nr:uncharacterized protein L969DRAFT_91378 [Mixia osmundae IAM 14324]KEI41906.1 hypothetical protein L969DRAFT_91378 [Mixia osmundae IAM 14324]GAA98700.1 hypothetical protein E5Q_05388 [Mixia osmundae IAM 14324]